MYLTEEEEIINDIFGNKRGQTYSYTLIPACIWDQAAAVVYYSMVSAVHMFNIG